MTAVWYSRRKLPAVPARAPRVTNTAVKPVTNPSAPVSDLLTFLSPPPGEVRYIYRQHRQETGRDEGYDPFKKRNQILHIYLFFLMPATAGRKAAPRAPSGSGGQIALRFVDCRRAVGHGSHHLAQRLGTHVAGRVNAGDVSFCRFTGDNIAVLV